MEIHRIMSGNRMCYYGASDAILLDAYYMPMLYGTGFAVHAAITHRFDNFRIAPGAEWRPSAEDAEACAIQLLARLALPLDECLYFEGEEVEPFICPSRYEHTQLINARARELPVSYYPRRKYRGSVYLMHCMDGLYKIGRAAFPSERQKALEREMGTEISIEHEIPAESPSDAEYWFHQVFAVKRVRLEWFALNAYDVEWVKCFTQWPYQGEG